MRLYRNEASDPRSNAQRNLIGRTHYVDDDTLRWHKSRILSARCTDGGMLFAITTSDALDMNNSKRGFRYVIFDVFGNMIERPDLEHAFKRHEPCLKAMWAALNALDAKAITAKAIEQAEKHFKAEMVALRHDVAKIETVKPAAA